MDEAVAHSVIARVPRYREAGIPVPASLPLWIVGGGSLTIERLRF